MGNKYFIAFTLVLLSILLNVEMVFADQQNIRVTTKEIHYADLHEYINVTIREANTDIINGTLSLSHGVKLLWSSPDNFVISNDEDEYCTFDETGSFKTEINSSSFQLSWKVKFNWTYPEGEIILGEKSNFYNSLGNSVNLTEVDLFYFEDDIVIDALYVDTGDTSFTPNVDNPAGRINNSRIVSSLPLPTDTEIVSAQSAPLYHGGVLHVWYGVKEKGGGEEDNKIIYTNTTDFVTWSDPLTVISLPEDGIRDPTIFVENDDIFLFCQCFNFSTGKYHPIRLYTIDIGSDYWNPELYNYVGDVLDLGEPGQFDDTWAASFCLTKIEDNYYGVYEAKDSQGVFSLGRTITNSITDFPYTKLGQVKNQTNQVLYNPIGRYNAIVPDTFANDNLLYVHYDNEPGNEESWSSRHISGDFPGNNLQISDFDLNPIDKYENRNNIAHLGELGKRYTFLMQSWNRSKVVNVHLYMEHTTIEVSNFVNIFGRICYEGNEFIKNSEYIKILAEIDGITLGKTGTLENKGVFMINNVKLPAKSGMHQITCYSITDEISIQNKTVDIKTIPPPLAGSGYIIKSCDNNSVSFSVILLSVLFLLSGYFIIINLDLDFKNKFL